MRQQDAREVATSGASSGGRLRQLGCGNPAKEGIVVLRHCADDRNAPAQQKSSAPRVDARASARGAACCGRRRARAGRVPRLSNDRNGAGLAGLPSARRRDRPRLRLATAGAPSPTVAARARPRVRDRLDRLASRARSSFGLRIGERLPAGGQRVAPRPLPRHRVPAGCDPALCIRGTRVGRERRGRPRRPCIRDGAVPARNGRLRLGSADALERMVRGARGRLAVERVFLGVQVRFGADRSPRAGARPGAPRALGDGRHRLRARSGAEVDARYRRGGAGVLVALLAARPRRVAARARRRRSVPAA